MGFGQEMKDFASGFEVGMNLSLRRQQARKAAAEAIKEEGPPEDYLNTPEGPGAAPQIQPSNGGGGGGTNQVAWNAASPEQKALLNTIAGPESGGDYNVIYGGGQFDDYSKHPGKYVTITSGPNKGQKSSAAGKYQFLESTWNDMAKKYHLEDFSPENQDKAAWYLAAEEYGRQTKRDLFSDLKSGDPQVIASIGPALKSQWTSLPGGIEQGTTTDKFLTAFNDNLKNASRGGEQAVASGEGVLPERPVYTQNTDVASVKGALNPKLDRVVQQAAADNPGLFALNPYTVAGKRTPEQQQEMVDKGYSGTTKSKHVEGKGIDIVPINPDTGQPDPDYKEGYSKVTEAMRRAADKVGVDDLKWGGEWGTPDLPHWQVSLLEQQQLQPGGISPPRDQEVQPAMFAASGGAIPEPTQNFQAGGVPNPAGDPDKYNPARAFTQAQPAAPASTFTPRRVGAPPVRAAAVAGAPSASQLKFRQFQADQAARDAAARAAAAQPVQQQTGGWEQAMKNQQFMDSLRRQAGATSGGTRDQSAANRASAAMRQMQAIGQQQLAAQKQAKAAGTDPWAAANTLDYRGIAQKSRFGRTFEEGGVIPEIGYAEGGAVEDRDATFQRLLREETRPGRGGQDSRDRAAKRLSHMEGRATSSAYSPTKDTEYWKPAKRAPGKKAPAGGSEKRPGKKRDEGVQEDRETRFREHEITDLGEDRATRERGGINDPRAGEMRERQPRAGGTSLVPAAGTPTSPYELRRAAGTPTAGYDPLAQPAGTPTQGYEPVPGPFPGRPEPDPLVGWDPYRNAPQSISSQRQPDVVEPLPERFAPEVIPVDPSVDAAQAQERLRQDWLSKQLGMAAGGVIPDPDEEEPISPRAESAAYTTSAPGTAATRPAPAATPAQEPAEERPKADLQATPKLLQDVSEAVRGGARFLTRHFGLDGQGDGAMPTPESGRAREDGIRRFASGEGAATPEELKGIDDKVDPNRELNEGDRQMTRLARASMWYLEKGMKNEAEAAAAGLMQYGAKKFSQLGSLSQAAYSKYTQTKDPSDLEAATKYLEKAYELIPDGGKMNVTIDPETGMLQAQRTDAEGKTETYDIKPDEIPGLIQQAQSASGYWKQIFRLSDPSAALQKERQEFEVTQKTGERKYEEGQEAEQRTYDEGQEAEERTYEEKKTLAEEEREAKRKAAEDKAAGEAKLAEETRAHERAKELKLMEEALKDKKPGDVTMEEISPALAAASDARKALDADKNNPELKKAFDESASRLLDVVQDPAKLEKLGFVAGQDFTYTGKVAEAIVKGANGEPVQTQGQPKQDKNGVWWVMGPNGKYIRLTPENQPAAAQ